MSAVAPFKPTVANSVHDPVEPLIERLEGLLADARTGKMRGIAYAVVYAEGSQPDGRTSTSWVLGRFVNFAMSHAILQLVKSWQADEV